MHFPLTPVDNRAMVLHFPEDPEDIAIQLQLQEIEQKEATTIDGKSHAVPLVGPVQDRFKKRNPKRNVAWTYRFIVVRGTIQEQGNN